MTPRILIVGPPAVGKTVVRRFIARRLRRSGPRRVASLGIDDALRTLFPKSGAGNTYRYDTDGTLELLDRRRQVLAALAHLARTAVARAGWEPIVVELSHWDYGVLPELFGASFLKGAMVIVMNAPSTTRLARNAQRGRSRVPDAVMEAYPSDVPTDVLTELRKRGSFVATVDASSSVESLYASIAALLRVALDRASNSPGRRGM